MNSKVIEKFKLSGKIAATALQHGAKMIKPSVKLVDVCDAVESKIKEMGERAWGAMMGFLGMEIDKARIATPAKFNEFMWKGI